MYTQSGEWVIISRAKVRFKIKDKIIKNLRFRIILVIFCAGILPCAGAYLGITKAYEAREISVRTAEIQNQCTILSDQLNRYHYLTDPSSEVINANLLQLTNIYNGRVMIVNSDLKVIKDTYDLDEGKTIVSENVVECMKGNSINIYDSRNQYIEVASPILDPKGKEITGVMLASVSTDTVKNNLKILKTNSLVIIAGVLIFVAAFGILIADRMVCPLHKITKIH